MDDLAGVAWLHRRAGFGLDRAALGEAALGGPAAELDHLLSATPLPATGAELADDWDDARLPLDPKDAPSRRYAVEHWLDRLVGTSEPLVERMAWLWHGHFVSSMDKVRVAQLMVGQVRLFLRTGLGEFPALVSAVATDPAMLVYLDGRESTAEAPNENFARELMELFTLGVGNYTEADVKAGAAAFSGWRIGRRAESATLVARRHDDRPRDYLGVTGVHDVATAVAAIAGHPAMPRFVASTVANELLGNDDGDLVETLASTFTTSGFRVDALVRATLEAGLAGAGRPIVLGPVLWLVIAQRVTGARLAPRQRFQALRAAGQLPMLPPNVAGWPGGPAWLASGTVVARVNLARRLAAATPDGPVLAAAADRDTDALADALGLPSRTFGGATAGTLAAETDPVSRLALALVSPELILA